MWWSASRSGYVADCCIQSKRSFQLISLRNVSFKDCPNKDQNPSGPSSSSGKPFGRGSGSNSNHVAPNVDRQWGVKRDRDRDMPPPNAPSGPRGDRDESYRSDRDRDEPYGRRREDDRRSSSYGRRREFEHDDRDRDNSRRRGGRSRSRSPPMKSRRSRSPPRRRSRSRTPPRRRERSSSPSGGERHDKRRRRD